ncbi:MAG: hypothetical protein KGL39_17150 [Patescibacteria group bacterium]|nr:hypothetical protein [Patescibacteria group bacterium]
MVSRKFWWICALLGVLLMGTVTVDPASDVSADTDWNTTDYSTPFVNKLNLGTRYPSSVVEVDYLSATPTGTTSQTFKFAFATISAIGSGTGNQIDFFCYSCFNNLTPGAATIQLYQSNGSTTIGGLQDVKASINTTSSFDWGSAGLGGPLFSLTGLSLTQSQLSAFQCALNITGKNKEWDFKEIYAVVTYSAAGGAAGGTVAASAGQSQGVSNRIYDGTFMRKRFSFNGLWLPRPRQLLIPAMGAV